MVVQRWYRDGAEMVQRWSSDSGSDTVAIDEPARAFEREFVVLHGYMLEGLGLHGSHTLLPCRTARRLGDRRKRGAVVQ